MKYYFFSGRLAALAMALGAMAAPALAADKSVAVTAIVEHPALDAARDGVRDELKAAGFEPGKNLRFEYQSAQGNTGTAAQIARKYVGDRPDVIVALATPSAQAVVAATKEVPVVYSAVTDPVAAKQVTAWISDEPMNRQAMIGTPVFLAESQMTGMRYATIRMMYCATCVQVTARMPPNIEQTRMPARPTKTASSNDMPRNREVMMPTPNTCATT